MEEAIKQNILTTNKSLFLVYFFFKLCFQIHLLQVSAVDRSILSYEAHKTKFEMVLYDWWDPRDDINLYCLYFYKETTSRIWENFNTNYEPMETRQFTLPEGKVHACTVQNNSICNHFLLLFLFCFFEVAIFRACLF